MSYPFPCKTDEIVFHITSLEYDKLFLSKLMFGLGI